MGMNHIRLKKYPNWDFCGLLLQIERPSRASNLVAVHGTLMDSKNVQRHPTPHFSKKKKLEFFLYFTLDNLKLG